MVRTLNNILEKFCKILIHNIGGKLFGITIIFIPAVFCVNSIVKNNMIRINVSSIISLIIVTYVGLFIGGYIHELGHFICLKFLKSKSKIKVMRNDHSKIIFFNMKTEIISDHPLNSTSRNLIYRSISGMLANIIAEVIFIIIGYSTGQIIFYYLACIQGFSGHGATSLASIHSDTDISTIRKALAIKDDVDIDIQDNGDSNNIIIQIRLNIQGYLEDPYWLLTRSKDIVWQSRDFISFDMGEHDILIANKVNKSECDLVVHTSKDKEIELITKTGRKIRLNNNKMEGLYVENIY